MKSFLLPEPGPSLKVPFPVHPCSFLWTFKTLQQTSITFIDAISIRCAFFTSSRDLNCLLPLHTLWASQIRPVNAGSSMTLFDCLENFQGQAGRASCSRTVKAFNAKECGLSDKRLSAKRKEFEGQMTLRLNPGLSLTGLPRWLSGKDSACQCRRCGFDLWVRKTQRRKWQPTAVSLPGKSRGRGAWQATVHGVTKSWTWLSMHPCTTT